MRDIPDDVYDTLVAVAREKHTSLNSLAVEQLTRTARYLRAQEHLIAYEPPEAIDLPISEAVGAIRQVRESS